VEAQRSAQRERTRDGEKTELACYPKRETALVNKVVSAGKARYSTKARLKVE
jgi:hypothetical protein